MAKQIQLKQQVALEALMKTSYCFKEIPPSLKNYVTANGKYDKDIKQSRHDITRSHPYKLLFKSQISNIRISKNKNN